MSSMKPLKADEVVGAAIVAMPVGYLVGGVLGVVGRGALSFFSPATASAAGNFATFGTVGLIAYPLMIIPEYISKRLLSQSSFLKTHPLLAKALEDTSSFLIQLGVFTAGAALVSSTFPATLAAMMIIPAISWALKMICHLVNACFGASETAKDELEASDRGMALR